MKGRFSHLAGYLFFLATALAQLVLPNSLHADPPPGGEPVGPRAPAGAAPVADSVPPAPVRLLEFVPAPGDWSGSTSQGRPVRFEVSQTSTHIRFFQITYEKECGSILVPETWMFIVFGGGDGIEIINNSFFISSPGRGFIETFTSNVTSSGTFNIDYYDEGLGAWCHAAGSWDAASETLGIALFLPVLKSDSEL